MNGDDLVTEAARVLRHRMATLLCQTRFSIWYDVMRFWRGTN